MADWGDCDSWSKQIKEHERAQEKAALSKTEES